MKNLKCNTNVVFGIFLLGLSALNMLIWLIDYRLLPFSYTSVMLFILSIFVLADVFYIKYKKIATKKSDIFGCFMPLIAIVFVITECFALELNPIYIKNWILYTEVLLIISMISALIIFFGSVKRVWMKIVCGSIACLGFIFIGFILFLSVIFANFGHIEITQVLDSPNEKYSAWIVNSDEGALGGDNSVYLRNKERDIFALFGTLKGNDHCILCAEWGENIELLWKSENILLVNGVEYNAPYITNSDYDNTYYSSKLRVYIPRREADFFEDTHGGFHGDGDTVMRYDLSEFELSLLKRDIGINEKWKPIDDISSKYINGGIDGFYLSGFAQEKIPVISDGYYCFYNKQTKTFDFPDSLGYSSNYILCVCSIKEKVIYVFAMDT